MTEQQVLTALERLNVKVDVLQSTSIARAGNTFSSSRASEPNKSGSTIEHPVVSARCSEGDVCPLYRHFTAPHRVMMWPAVHAFFAKGDNTSSSELHEISREGTIWFMKQLVAKAPKLKPGVTVIMDLPRRLYLTLDKTKGGAVSAADAFRYAEIYFDTFHVLHPFLDEEEFMCYTLPNLLDDSHPDDAISHTLALLVLSLGQMAHEGVVGEPVHHDKDLVSGIRGGSRESPPGIDLFNQARRSLGFHMTGCGLQNVQASLLQAIYFEANAMHLEYWQCATEASTACKALLHAERIDWGSHDGDMVKRVFWACIVNEDLFHHDLDLPRSCILMCEESIALPTFSTDSAIVSKTSAIRKDRSLSQMYCLATIGLRNVISHIHDALRDSKSKNVMESSEF